MNVFGMVTTRSSAQYTEYALHSFFENTHLEQGDLFFLIDNDRSYEIEQANNYPDVKLISNPSPRSFAANVNQIMAIAGEKKANLFFLNNDLIFTPNWIDPLLVETQEILSPLSNREIAYAREGFRCKTVMSLSEYLGHEEALKAIVQNHRSKARGYGPILAFPFFCVKLPYSVYSLIGPLDESFGKGGAEDDDYCIRAHLAGFSVKYALRSYILHFIGKSTWSGGETKAETEERCATFRSTFETKWGKQLLALLVDHDLRILEKDPLLKEKAHKGDFQSVIKALHPTTSDVR